MSINACTINSHTLNAFCVPRRQIIFDRLVDELHPQAIQGTNPRVARNTFQIPRQFEIEDKPTLTFEQPIVSVTVELFGMSGTETQDVMAANLDFVTVTDFDVDATSVSVSDLDFGFGTPPLLAVNITDFNID